VAIKTTGAGPLFSTQCDRGPNQQYLTRPKLFRGPVTLVVGENPVEDVDDRRFALATVEPDMTAPRYDRPADPQLTIFEAVYLFGEIDGGEHRFSNPFVIRGRLILSECEASGKEGPSHPRPSGHPQSCFQRHSSVPLLRAGTRCSERHRRSSRT
jgi:hypothetical protein